MHINLLGSCQVFWQERPLAVPRRQTRALLYRLAAALEPIPRGHLAFLFWPDIPDAAARRSLTRLLSSLRVALPHPDLLLVDEENVALDPARVSSDSQQLLHAAQRDDPALLEAAAARYRGPFMAGFALPDAPEYDAWQAQTARELEALYLAALERLAARYAATGDTAAAIRCAQRYLAVDELAEAMQQRLISLYVASGDRAAAQRQYEQCALALERELGVSPLPETAAALHANHHSPWWQAVNPTAADPATNGAVGLPAVPAGVVRGTAWLDSNGDCIRQPWESPLAGVPVTAAGQTAVTDADGRFCFYGIAPRTPGVTAVLPDGLTAQVGPAVVSEGRRAVAGIAAVERRGWSLYLAVVSR